MKARTFLTVTVLCIGIALTLAWNAVARNTPAVLAAPPASMQNTTLNVNAPLTETVELRWFIGLGGGTGSDQTAVAQQAVDDFNAAHPNIHLTLEVQPNNIAPNILRNEIMYGNPPDLVGPVGILNSNTFKGYWTDLDALLTTYDLTDFDPNSLDAWRAAGGGLIGLPVGDYPSMIYYNKDLFDAAGLAYPPHEYGQPYTDTVYGGEWTITKTEEIAMLLTLDNLGRNANDPSFDSNNIVQFGFDTQWADLRAQAALFGAGSFVDSALNATISDNWRAGLHWFYDGMWSKHFIPNDPYRNSGYFGNTNVFNSGHLAMAHTHTWYTCCIGDLPNWDLAAVPSYDGVSTAKFHTDMIGLLNTTQHPTEAVEAIYALTSNPDLIQTWGALPARQSLRAGFWNELETQFPGVDWQVALDSLNYIEIPSTESWLPNMSDAMARLNQFKDLYGNNSGLDLDSEINTLLSDLQGIFDNNPGPSNLLIRQQPICGLATGESAHFAVSADGTLPMTYTWTLDGAPIGSNQSTLDHTFTLSDTYTLAVTVTNRGGTTYGAIFVEAKDPASIPAGLIQLRWFQPGSMNLGSLEVLQQAADRYNASQANTCVGLEPLYLASSSTSPYTVIRNEITYGDPPDIVGDLGIFGSVELQGYWLDLNPRLTGYDLSDYDPNNMAFWNSADWGLVGLPVGSYPSMIYYNKDLFDAAGLAYPPHEYGQPYTDTVYGGAWTITKTEQIAMLLTLDENGKNATETGFDPDHIVQFGFDAQWTDPRGEASLFGASSFVDSNLNATISDNWRAGLHWFYDGMWSQYFISNDPYRYSPWFNNGNVFASGHVAMVHTHLWYTCCIGAVSNWDLAAVPSYDGVSTAKLHTDMIGVLNTTQHPAEAVDAVYALTSDPIRILTRTAIPARLSMRPVFMSQLATTYPGVDWQVALDGLNYIDIPSAEGWMPNYTPAVERINQFQYLYGSNSGLDLDTEIDILVADLQNIFNPCNGINSLQLSRLPAGDLFTGDTVKFTAQLNGSSPIDYTWTLDSLPVGANQNTYEQAFTSAETYTVSVTAANRCSSESTSLTFDVNSRTMLLPDLSTSSKSVNLTNVEQGDILLYTLVLRNSNEVSAAATLTDVIPTYTTYITGSAQTSNGTPVVVSDEELSWSGDVASGSPVIIQFSVEAQVAPVGGQINNVAFLHDGVGNVIPLTASSIYNPGYQLSIDNGLLFTNIPTVTLSYSWHVPDQILFVKFSNDGGFGADSTGWLPVDPANPVYTGWVLATYGTQLMPRTVYVKFRDTNGVQYGPFQDDIVYDPTNPQVTDASILAQTSAFNLTNILSGQSVTIRVTASDDNSGVSVVQVSNRADFSVYSAFTVSGASTDIIWTLPASGKVYVRVVDRAGNKSDATFVQGTPNYTIYLPITRR